MNNTVKTDNFPKMEESKEETYENDNTQTP